MYVEIKYNIIRLLFVATFLLQVCPVSAEERKPDIFFILYDALRADHVGAYGYKKPTTPNIDMLAKDSIVFEDSSSASVSTSGSLPKLFSGAFNIKKHIQWLPAWRTAARTYPPGVTLLNADLQRIGYHTVIISAHRGIRGSDLDTGFDELFYVRTPSPTIAYQPAPEMFPILKEILSRKRDKPLFVYIHAMDSHFPHPKTKYFNLFTDALKFQSKIMQPNGYPHKFSGIPLSDKEKHHLRALYDGNVRLGDEFIGELLAFLKHAGTYDESMILITADHGDMLGGGKEDNYIGHAGTAWQEQIFVPWILKTPGNQLAGTRVSYPVSALDVKPTVLDLVSGPDALEGMVTDGIPLIREGSVVPEPNRVVPIHGGFRYKDLKVLNNGPRIYDLAADPGEEHNLIASGWPEKWPGDFQVNDLGVRYGDIEILRPHPQNSSITIFFSGNDPEYKHNLLQTVGLPLQDKGYAYPSQPFYISLSSAKIESPESVLNLTNSHNNNLDPRKNSKTPEWVDGKWSMLNKWLWHSPDEDPGEAVFRLNMDSALDGEYGISVIMSRYHYEGGNASEVQVSLDGTNWITASTEDNKDYPKIDNKPVVPIGTARVTNGTLSIHLKPERELLPEDQDERENKLAQADKRHWAIVYAFKFAPLEYGAASISDEEQAERLEQLRGLGYIQ